MNKKIIIGIIATIIFISILIYISYFFYTKQSINNIEIKIKEGTLTPTSATIVIIDKNINSFWFSDWFKIEIEKNGEWKELEEIKSYEIIPRSTAVAFKAKKGEAFEISQEWSKIYGELENGRYRLVKKLYENEYIWVEFVIE